MHAVIDDFAPAGLVRSLAATWLPIDSPHWHLYGNGKLATKDPSRLPVAAHCLLAKMTEIPIAELIAVPGTFPDLEYLHGAGLHHMPAGATLGLHLDSERHPQLPWRREASAVLYLDDAIGGELELCDEHGRTITQIASKSNRLVVLSTPHQWHRVAECRSARRSLCLFAWSADTAATGFTQAQFRE